MEGVKLAIATFLYVFNVSLSPLLQGDTLIVNGTVHTLSSYYFPDCHLNLILYGDKHLLVKEVPLQDTFYHNVLNFSEKFNISFLPTGKYSLSYYIKCGKIHYIPGIYSVHLSLNPLFPIVILGKGNRYNFEWINDKEVNAAYIDKSKFELSGSTGTYAPLVYGDKISFTLYLNKKAKLLVEQCSRTKCYKLYERMTGPGYVKDFLNLYEKKSGEIYWIKFKVIDLDFNTVTDYFEMPIVFPGNNPNFILAYIDENSTHLLFKPVDPNLRTEPWEYTVILDGVEKKISLPEITREEIYDFTIEGLYNKVCIKELDECYTFDTQKYLARISEINELIKTYSHKLEQNVTNETLIEKKVIEENITRPSKEKKEKREQTFNYLPILVAIVIIIGFYLALRKLRS